MIKNTDKTRSILKYVMFFLLFSGVGFRRFELFSRILWILGLISLLVLAFMHYRHDTDTITCDESKKKRITIVNWICFIIIVAFIVLYLFLLLGVVV